MNAAVLTHMRGKAGSARVDDANPSVIYSPPLCLNSKKKCSWTRSKNNNAHKKTLTSTGAANSNVTFHFAGTGIAVYGALPAKDARQTYYVLSENPSRKHVTSTTGPLANTSPDHHHDVLLYQSPNLSNKNHTLFISNLSGHLSIDYLVVEKPSTMMGLDKTSSDPPPRSSLAPPPVQALGGPPKHGVPVGAVVGGVLAGLALLIGAALAFFYVRRKRMAARRRRDAANDWYSQANPARSSVATFGLTSGPLSPAPPAAWRASRYSTSTYTTEHTFRGDGPNMALWNPSFGRGMPPGTEMGQWAQHRVSSLPDAHVR